MSQQRRLFPENSMGFWPAFLICACGTAGLFYLDRDDSVRNGRALWLPVVWLWIVGSRPASQWLWIWFGIGQSGGGSGLDAQLEGSPLDAAIFMVLSGTAIGVVLWRRRRTIPLLKKSAPVIVYFFYCLVSCMWSPFPDVAFKRWVKDVGDLAMVLVVITDPDPIGALRRVYSRVGFVLLPASILLIRYSSLGQAYDPGGGQMYTGVTTNKNSLGLITFVVSLGALWSFLWLLNLKRSASRTRQLVARGMLVAFGVAVLQLAKSATSTLCFALGALLILGLNLSVIKRRPRRVHVLTLGLLLFGGAGYLLGGKSVILNSFGKNETLSDRTTIWNAVIPVCPDPIVGAGFESFWNGYGKYVTKGLSQYEIGLNSAHNGYIEVYLNLGLVGVGLVVMLLLIGYFRASTGYRFSPIIGSLLIAYVFAVAFYGITEAGFRIMTPTWIVLLLVLVGSRSLALCSASAAAPHAYGALKGKFRLAASREEHILT